MQYIDTLPAYEDCAWKAARGIELEPVEQRVLEYSARAREPWGTFDQTSILKLLDYVQEMRAELIQQTNRAAAAEKLRADQMTQRLDMANRFGNDARAELAQLRQAKDSLRAALEDIASGEIMRSHCTGPHCVEARCVATADEMASRAAGALEWDDHK